MQKDDRHDASQNSTDGSKVTVTAHHADGSDNTFTCSHTLSPLQVKWFRAGSALNYLREQSAPATV